MTDAQHMAALVRTAARTARAGTLPALPFSQYRRFADEGDRLGYEELYFRRRAHVTALAAEQLVDAAADTAALADALWSVCDEYTWALPAHETHATALGRGMDQCLDLFAALTAHLLAETVRLAGDRLDPRVTARVTAAVEHRVLTLLADDDRRLPWEDQPHNWAAVCGGAAGLAALALWEPGPRLDRLLSRVRGSMRGYLSGFADDGGCAEGVGYWAFGFAHFVYFAEELRERTGDDLLDDPKVRAVAGFPAAVHLGDGLFPAFSDAEERPALPAGLAHRLAARLGVQLPPVPRATALPRDWGDLSRTLRWGTSPPPDPAADGARALGARRGTRRLADLEWVVDRGEGRAFAAKGGHNAEPHNHNDLGHFMLCAAGEALLTDLGAGEYRKGSFDDATRYGFLHNSSLGHSVPVVAARPQSAGRRHAARALRYEPVADGVDYALDLTAGYDVPGLTALRRGFCWRRATGQLVLTDEVVLGRGMPLDEVFISRLRPAIGPDGTVLWHGRRAAARLRPPPGCTVHPEAVATTGHDGRPDTVHRLRLRFALPAGTSVLRFVFTLHDAA